MEVKMVQNGRHVCFFGVFYLCVVVVWSVRHEGKARHHHSHEYNPSPEGSGDIRTGRPEKGKKGNTHPPPLPAVLCSSSNRMHTMNEKHSKKPLFPSLSCSIPRPTASSLRSRWSSCCRISCLISQPQYTIFVYHKRARAHTRILFSR